MLEKLKYNTVYELDSPERTIFHQKIISEKKFLRKLYEEWYKVFANLIPNLPEGKIVELGSGGGFFKKIEPSVICSDVLDLPTNDLTFSALEMPFKDNEISAVFMIDTFHHIPDSGLFLKEIDRVLKKNGMLVMIEPANSLWGRFIYKNFHHEPFDVNANWEIPTSGPLSGANGALPWIVFKRDIRRFETDFSNLKLTEYKYHTPFRYLVSGGVSFKQLMPNFTYPFFRLFDISSSFVSKHLSMFVTIKLLKVK
jgi:SAM-dependent methyltransferase